MLGGWWADDRVRRQFRSSRFCSQARAASFVFDGRRMAAAAKSEVEGLVAKITDKKDGQSALEGLAKLAEAGKPETEPFLVAAVGPLLEATGDKSKAVKAPPRAHLLLLLFLLFLLSSHLLSLFLFLFLFLLLFLFSGIGGLPAHECPSVDHARFRMATAPPGPSRQRPPVRHRLLLCAPCPLASMGDAVA